MRRETGSPCPKCAVYSSSSCQHPPQLPCLPQMPTLLPGASIPSHQQSWTQCWSTRSPGLCLEEPGARLGTLFFSLPPYPQSAQGGPRLRMGFGEGKESSPGAWFSFSCSSVSLCGKLLKVIKHPEVVKCTINEVLINTPQEKNKKTPLTPLNPPTPQEA